MDNFAKDVRYLGSSQSLIFQELKQIYPELKAISREGSDSCPHSIRTLPFENPEVFDAIRRIEQNTEAIETELFVVMRAMPSAFFTSFAETMSLLKYNETYPIRFAVTSALQQSGYTLRSVPADRKIFILDPADYRLLWSNNPVAEQTLIEFPTSVDQIIVLDSEGEGYLRKLGVPRFSISQVSSLGEMQSTFASSPIRKRVAPSLTECANEFIAFINRAIARAASQRDAQNSSTPPLVR